MMWVFLLAFIAYAESIANTPTWPGPSFAWGTLPTGNTQWDNGNKDRLTGEAAGTRAGCNSVRLSYPEAFALQWGYGIRSATVDAYATFGETNVVTFLNGPDPTHSMAPGCPAACGNRDQFPPSNLYEPIWSSPGVVNPNNFWAVHIQNMMLTFAGRMLTFEVWNEPDFLNPAFPWAVTQPGTSNNGDNWWTRPPKPAELQNWNAEIYSYIRMLRIVYDVSKHFGAAAGKQVYVAVGGLGYEGFLDAVCRLTEKDPAVTYPATSDVDGTRTGCEYFDMTSLHYYPTLNHDAAHSNSDDFANDLVKHKKAFQAVTEARGYKGSTAKEYIYTETGLASPAFQGKGGEDVRKGYMIKAGVLAAVNGIRQLHWFTAIDGGVGSEFGQMGLFEAQVNPETPATVPMKDSTKAMFTFMRVLRVGDKNFDAAATATIQAALPANVRAFVFRAGATATRVTVIWVSTVNRGDENVPTVSVTLPTNNPTVQVATYDNTRTTLNAAAGSVTFTVGGTPVFVDEVDTAAPATTPAPAAPTTAAATAAPTTTAAAAGTTAAATTATPATTPTPTTTAAAQGTTAAAGATTAQATTGAGGTTAPQATTAAGGTTAQATAQGTTAAGGASTSRTTTVAGGSPTTAAAGGGNSQPTTAAGASCTPAPLVSLPLESCVLACCPASADRTKLTFRMSTVYTSWRCPAWLAQAATILALAPSSLKVCTHYSGSSVIEVDMPAADAATIMAASAPPAIPEIISITAPDGRMVATPAPFPWWIIVIVVVAVLLLAALIIGCILYRRHKEREARSAVYTPLADTASFKQPQVAATAAARPSSAAVPFRLRQDVVDQGEGILSARAGDICFVERADLGSEADWQYVQIGTKHGYVPRLLLEPV